MSAFYCHVKAQSGIGLEGKGNPIPSIPQRTAIISGGGKNGESRSDTLVSLRNWA